MTKKVENIVDKIIYLFLKYLYIFIFFPKSIQILFIIFLIILILGKNNFKLKLSKDVIPIFLVGILNLISIIFSLSSHHEISRLFAALNTSLLWCFCAIVYTYVKSNNLNYKRIEKYMFNNICILISLSILMIILNKIGINEVTLFSRKLMRTDWLYGVKSQRFRGFMLYDNLVSQMYFLSFPFAYSYVERKKNNFFKLLFLLISILPVVMCKSRMGIVLCIIMLCLLFPASVVKTKKAKNLLYLMYGILLLLGVKFDYIYNKIFNLINGRSGSTNARMIIYQTSIEMALKRSPIIGCGVKDMIGDYPLGSHSTYVGLFYKTGIIGLCLGILGIINTLKPLKKLPLHYRIAGICLFFMLITGDLDGENWLIILYGILYGSLATSSK